MHPKSTDSLSLNLFIGGNSPDAKPLAVLASRLDVSASVVASAPLPHFRWNHPKGRNKRSVWSIATQPYDGAHFAVFPPELPRLCILAGCPEGGTVLDPFAGSGTTLWVAQEHARKAIGIELNADYLPLIQQRCQQQTIWSVI